MGCASSIPKGYSAVGKRKKKKGSRIDEVVVFVPMLQILMAVDLVHPLRGLISRELTDKLCSLRNWVVSVALENDLVAVHDVSELQQALEEYLPLLFGLTVKEYNLESLIEFKWQMLGEDGKQNVHETCIASAWYEVLCVHLMAILSLLQANLGLIPKESSDKCKAEVSEDSKKVVVDLLLKASGCLDYCVRHIMVHLLLKNRKNLLNGLQEGMLEAILIQALSQVLEENKERWLDVLGGNSIMHDSLCPKLFIHLMRSIKFGNSWRILLCNIFIRKIS